MEFIWQIMLTVCLGSKCIYQDVQWFDTQSECREMLAQYVSIPADGDWDTVKYECKPVGSTSL